MAKENIFKNDSFESLDFIRESLLKDSELPAWKLKREITDPASYWGFKGVEHENR